MSDDISDETYTQAHAELGKAIVAYYAAIAPDVYVDSWVLISHKRSPEMEQQRTSGVGVLTAEGQPWVMTRGLLDVALQRDRDTLRNANDGS